MRRRPRLPGGLVGDAAERVGDERCLRWVRDGRRGASSAASVRAAHQRSDACHCAA